MIQGQLQDFPEEGTNPKSRGANLLFGPFKWEKLDGNRGAYPRHPFVSANMIKAIKGMNKIFRQIKQKDGKLIFCNVECN